MEKAAGSRIRSLAMRKQTRAVDRPHYHGDHWWARKNKAKPDRCESCQGPGPLELANVSGIYLRDISDWRHLCRRCHMASDGRLRILVRTGLALRLAKLDEAGIGLACFNSY